MGSSGSGPSGEFKFQNGIGEKTGCLATNSAGSVVQSALNGLASFDSVTVVRNVLTSPGNGFSWEIEFSGAGVAGNQAELKILMGAVDGCAAVPDTTVAHI